MLARHPLRWGFRGDGVSIGGIIVAVLSFVGRRGHVAAVSGDYAASQVTNDSAVAGATVRHALEAVASAIPGVPVTSVLGRVGTVVAASGDYAASLLTNDSSVAGATVRHALEALASSISSVSAAVSALSSSVSASIASLSSTKLDKLVTSVTYTDLARTFQASDADKSVAINVATDAVYTVPPAVFAIGTVLQGIVLGVGRVTFAPGAGVTIVGTSLITRTRYSAWALYQRASNQWELVGDMSA